MPSNTHVPLFFYLLAIAATSTFCLQGLDTIQLAQTQILQLREQLQSSLMAEDLNQQYFSGNFGTAISDCVKLYSESEFRLSQLLDSEANHTHDDARTWLSSMLANHRTCLDGLNEKWFLQTDRAMAQNLTLLLSKSLALYGPLRRTKKGAVPPRPTHSSGGGLLTSWDPQTSKADFVVARDGSGTHDTINDALDVLDRLGNRRTRRVIIYVKEGIYNEKVDIDHRIKGVMLIGDGIDRTIITGSRNVPDGYSTFSSATFGVSGDGFWARDITFENTAGPHKHQAVALRVSSDFSVFYRCSFKAYQDTLFVLSSRQFYRDCHIYGTIDFIFGDAAAVFQNCDIFVRKPMNHQANFITAQGRDNQNENTGISIQGSRVRPSPDFVVAKNSIRSFLGRPWRKYSRTVFMETDLDGFIDPMGWGTWHGDYALSTLFYAEYMNTGHGASTSERVKWPGYHVFNSPEQARPFTINKFIQGESWIPVSGVPFWPGI